MTFAMNWKKMVLRYCLICCHNPNCKPKRCMVMLKCWCCFILCFTEEREFGTGEEWNSQSKYSLRRLHMPCVSAEDPGRRLKAILCDSVRCCDWGKGSGEKMPPFTWNFQFNHCVVTVTDLGRSLSADLTI